MTQVKKKKSKPKAIESNEPFMSIYHKKWHSLKKCKHKALENNELFMSIYQRQ